MKDPPSVTAKCSPKLRVARPGQGKSGGYRTLLAYRKSERSVFLYGFAKNERDNIDEAARGGITAVVQPGGSMRDQDSIQACDEHNLAMVLTGVRHFRH